MTLMVLIIESGTFFPPPSIEKKKEEEEKLSVLTICFSLSSDSVCYYISNFNGNLKHLKYLCWNISEKISSDVKDNSQVMLLARKKKK